MLHFNISKYNPASSFSVDNSIDYRDVFINYDKNLKFVAFMTVENSKKGLLIS